MNLRALAGLLDDAALFPPGNAAMPAAVAGHVEHRQSWYAEVVGSFVCSAARVDELDAELQRQGASVELALTVPGGVSELAPALKTTLGLSGARLVAVEVATEPGAQADVREVLAEHAEDIAGYLEFPVAAVDRWLAQQVRELGLRIKLRTGGLAPEAFPSVEELGVALAATVDAELAIKCTAGLHHLVRHRDPATGLVHHGFGNVLLAVVAALAGEDPVAELADEHAAGVQARLAALSDSQLAGARAIFTSFGTCSVADPRDDLLAAGLLQTP